MTTTQASLQSAKPRSYCDKFRNSGVSWGVTGTPTSFRSTCFSFLLAQYRSSKFVTGFNFGEKRKIFFQEYTIKDSGHSKRKAPTPRYACLGVRWLSSLFFFLSSLLSLRHPPVRNRLKISGKLSRD